jgi:FkbM family methyltransferase
MYRYLYLFGDHEPFQTSVYRQLVPKGGICLDVGASFGWYAVLFARWVGSLGRVYAFEPLPSVAELTRDAVRLNDCEEVVRVVATALGRESGNLRVHTFRGLPQGHASALDMGRVDATPHECQMTTLDEFVVSQGIEAADFMKVDVEGFEYDVFEGGRAFLESENAPIVSFEINEECLRSRRVRASEIQELLRCYGYSEFWAIDPRKGLHPFTGEIADRPNRDYLAAKKGRPVLPLLRGSPFHRAGTHGPLNARG